MTALVVFGAVVVYLALLVLLGRVCALSDETRPARLSRRPNVKRVRRDPEQVA